MGLGSLDHIQNQLMYFPLPTCVCLQGQRTLVAEYRGQAALASNWNLKQMVPHADTDLQHTLMAFLVTPVHWL